MKASDLLIKCLENEGVKYIFGIPGEETLDLLESIRKSKIKFIPTRHEQSAGFMAATYGRLTGKAGVALSTLGPGATNFVTAAAYAKLGAMPMLMVTGQKPIKTAPQGSFQKIDVVGMMKPITKFSKQVVHEKTIPSVIREAFRIAQEERPGPVHIELPMDIAGDEVNVSPISLPRMRRPVAEEKSINWAVEMIENATSPLILIGAGANRKLTSKVLREFIDKTGIPFFDTQMGVGVVDERHPLFLGTATFSSNDYLHCAVERADLIINVGHDIIEKPPFLMKEGKPNVIHVNFYPADVDQIYSPQVEVIGDISNAIWQIKERITPQAKWDFAYFKKVKKQIDEKVTEKTIDNSFPLLPQRIVSEVRKAMPEDGIVTLDNGMYKLWFTRNYRTYKQNTLLVDNALATMGAGLPSGIMAKIINPDKKVLVVAGDGGFMMNSQELETAVRLKLDLVILVIRDNAYGMIKWKQKNENYSDFGLDLGNPDFVKYAESYGANGYRVEKAEDLGDLLNTALNQKGVSIIDCEIDYSENVKVFDEELKNKVCIV